MNDISDGHWDNLIQGSRYVNKMAGLSERTHLHVDTKTIISKERQRRERHNMPDNFKGAQRWQYATTDALRSRSYAHYKDQISVSAREHMSEVDCFDGGKARKGSIGEVTQEIDEDEDLVTIHPVIDGRLKDEGRS